MDRLSCFYSFFLSLHHKSKALVHFVGLGSGEPGRASGKLISLPGMNAGATTVHRSSITPLLSCSHVVSLVREFSLFLFPANVSRIFTSHESVLIFFKKYSYFCCPPPHTHFKYSVTFLLRGSWTRFITQHFANQSQRALVENTRLFFTICRFTDIVRKEHLRKSSPPHSLMNLTWAVLPFSEILQHISAQKHIRGHYSLFWSPLETVMPEMRGCFAPRGLLLVKE